MSPLLFLLPHLACLALGDLSGDHAAPGDDAAELIRSGCAELLLVDGRYGLTDQGPWVTDEDLEGFEARAGLVDACENLLRSSGLSVGPSADVAGAHTALPPGLQRRLVSGSEWYDNPSSYYIPPIAIAFGVLCLLVVFQEGLFLRTTLVPLAPKANIVTNEFFRSFPMNHGEGKDKGGSCSKVQVEGVPARSEKAPSQVSTSFWEEMRQKATVSMQSGGPTKSAAPGSERAVIGFTRRDFAGLEAKGTAKVTLERKGNTRGRVVVQVRTRDNKSAGPAFMAEENRDYVPFNDRVTFEDGVTLRSIILQLKPTDESWSPTRWFRIEITQVVEGDAVLGGPTVTSKDSSDTMSVRVFILQDDTFPGGIPQKYLSKISMEQEEKPPEGAKGAKPASPADDDMRFLLYYWKERIKSRKAKFWYTLAGLCYQPVHNAVVTPIVFSFMLNWAADPSEGGNYSAIVALVCVQCASYLLLRWGDVSQTRNRGRTGGVRMLHRQQLLDKILLMEHVEQWEKPGNEMFYAGLMNVDVMVTDGYWQMYIMIQSLLGLLLVLIVLFWKAAYKAAQNDTSIQFENLLPALVLLVLTPLSFKLIARRRERAAELLQKRMEGEEDWVEVFSWLAANGPRIYTLGMRELANVVNQFSGLNKSFLKNHQGARDVCNDSTWITKWLGGGAYTVILLWASLRLLHARAGLATNFEAGDCVLLIQLFDRFTRYLTKVSDSFVKIQRGAVSIRRVSQFLSLTECRSLFDLAAKDHEVDHITDPLAKDGWVELKDVAIKIPTRKDSHGFGPAVDIQQLPGKVLSIPLGKVIFVKGGTEAQHSTFLKLLAGLLRSEAPGRVTFPAGQWCVLAPPIAVHITNRKVSDDFELAGASPDAAKALAEAMGLDPSEGLMRMAPGQASMQALGKSMLRDPTVLIAIRPIGSAPLEMREKIMHLLLAWQSSGGGPMLCESLGKTVTGAESPSAVGSNRMKFPRTLVLSGEPLPPEIPSKFVHEIDLSMYFRGFEPPSVDI